MPSTAYAARQPPQEEGERPVTVLVTGFGVRSYDYATLEGITPRVQRLCTLSPWPCTLFFIKTSLNILPHRNSSYSEHLLFSFKEH